MDKRFSSFEETAEKLVTEAREVLRVDENEILRSWDEVEQRVLVIQRRRKIGLSVVLAVASVALLMVLSLSYVLNRNTGSLWAVVEYSVDSLDEKSNEVELITSTQIVRLKDESAIVYDKSGNTNITAEQKVGHERIIHPPEVAEVQKNYLSVPSGRRATITFSDGTRMNVNSGTKVEYPAVFASDKREITVDGEVFLEVAKEAERPFIVKGNGVTVKVLGTRFDFCAYKEDSMTSVVLVCGQVEVSSSGNETKTVLQPNQRVMVKEGVSTLTEVDVFEYICWTENMMYLNDRKFGEAVKQLERYYDRKMVVDPGLNDLVISGKLDLKEELEEVVGVVCQTLHLSYGLDKDSAIIIQNK